jgi:hypothetical protein
MTVSPSAIGNTVPKYKNAVAIRSVTGGAAMNIMTVPGVTDEPFKAALEGSLAAHGYLANATTPKFLVDAEIQNLQQPLFGLDMNVQATVVYKISGSDGTNVTYPISAQGTASFSDSPLGVDRMRIANERAMQENITQFLKALR